MARFQITAPDGSNYEVEAPDTASEQDVMSYFQSQLAQQPKREEYGTLAAGAEGVGQGVSFGFSDEIEGGVRALIDKIQNPGKEWGKAWEEGVSAPRERQSHAAETNPYAYYGGQIAGGVAVPAGLAGIGVRGAGAAGASLRARSAAGAREGAAYGAAYGAGTAEGGIPERAMGAGAGAASGALMGSILPGAVDLASATARGVTAPIRGMVAPQSTGYGKLAEALVRDKNPGGEVMQRSAYNVTDDLARLRAQSGKPMMLADLGGENTRNVLRSATNMASTGSQRINRTLDKRQSGQWSRIEKDMGKALGSPDDFAKEIDQIVATRSAAADADFNKAYARPVAFTPKLQEILSRPTMQDITTLVERRLADDGQQMGQMPPMRALHQIKVELDEQIKAARKAQQTGNKPTSGFDVGTLTRLKHQYVAAIDNPDYQTALKNFAGDSALKGAAEDGFENALKINTDELARSVRGKTKGELDMWRLGASRALAQEIRRGNVTRDRTENVFSSPDMQIRMRAIFPDLASRREFQRNLILEAKMADTRKAVQSGPTTAKQLAQGDEAGNPIAGVTATANAAMGRMEPFANWLARGKNRFSGITPPAANAIIDAAMSRGGSAVPKAFEKAVIEAKQAPAKRAAKTRSMLGGATAASAPAASGYWSPESGLRGGVGPRYDEFGRLRRQ